MESLRSVRITLEVDTNKQTVTREFDNVADFLVCWNELAEETPGMEPVVTQDDYQPDGPL